MASREKFVLIAKLAEQSERFDDMVDAMKKVAQLDVELTAEERNLLSGGYKNVIGGRRASWRILSSIEQKEEARGNEVHVEWIKEYKQKIESELSSISNDIMKLVDEHLIPSASAGESTVFYYKMKGDYYRYLAEFKTGNEKKEAADQSMKAYETATTAAEADLPSTHPIRLGLALNFSVFYYEILNSPDRACFLAKEAFDEAISDLDTLNEESYKESTLIMQLLRDNLTLWPSDIPEDGADSVLHSLLEFQPKLWGLPPFEDWVENALPIEPIHVSGVSVSGSVCEVSENGTPTLPDQVFGLYFGWAKVDMQKTFKVVVSIGWDQCSCISKRQFHICVIDGNNDHLSDQQIQLLLVGYLRGLKGKVQDITSMNVVELEEYKSIASASLDLPMFVHHACDCEPLFPEDSFGSDEKE